MTFMWRYLFATFTMFLIAPELRRIQDMFIGYSPLEIWSILPLIMLIPFFYALGMHQRYRRIPQVFCWMAWLWVGGFTYALLLSLLAENFAAGLLTYLQFVLPIGAGLWIATEELPASIVYNRLVHYLFITTTLLCIYGIIQWVVIPPWDALWLANIHATSFGLPLPFKLRSFSTLNGPGIFGNFVALIAILGLPRVTPKDWKFTAAFGIWIIAMGVTAVRTSWVMFGLGALIYFLLTRRFKQLFSILALGIVVTFSLATFAPESPLVTLIAGRASSLGNVQNDASFNQRSDLYVDMIPKVLETPAGMGLGIFGAGGKISAAGEQIDSGILSRLLEMGWGGAGMLAAALCIALMFTFQGFLEERNNANTKLDVFVTLIGVQMALLFLETSGEAHLGIIGLLFWTTLAPLYLPARIPLPSQIHRTDAHNTIITGTA